MGKQVERLYSLLVSKGKNHKFSLLRSLPILALNLVPIPIYTDSILHLAYIFLCKHHHLLLSLILNFHYWSMFKWLCSLQPKEPEQTFNNESTYCVLGAWDAEIPLHLQSSVTRSRTNIINRWFRIHQKDWIFSFPTTILYYWFLSAYKSINPGLTSFLTFSVLFAKGC